MEAPGRTSRSGPTPDRQPLRTLETARLVLRPSEVGDAAVLRHLWTERDPRVPAHRRLDPDGHPTVEDVAARLEAQPYAGGPRLLTVVVRATGEPIGYCGLNPSETGAPDEAELAYELLRTAQGRGYATEAAGAVVACAALAGFVRLRAGVWSWNLASRRVLAKLGFREGARGGPTSEHGQTIRTTLELGGSFDPGR